MFKRTTICGEISLKEAGCVEDLVSVLLNNGYTVQITKCKYDKMLDVAIMKYEEAQ